MTTYTRNTLSGSLAPVNNELEKIEVSLREKLDRNPSVAQNNEMLDDLDMNSNRIINYPDAVNDSDLITKGQVASLAPVQSVNGATGDVVVATNIQIDTNAIFDNIAEMKTADLEVGDYVKCKRYYALGDLVNGLEFEVVAAGTGTEDGGSFHNLTNGNQVELIQKDSVNVKHFGVIGDGLANGTASIQTAYDYAATVKTNLYIPSGTYLGNWVFTKGIHVFGDGQLRTVLKPITTAAVIEYTSNNSTDLTHASISDISIRGDDDTVGTGIIFGGTGASGFGIIKQGVARNIYISGFNTGIFVSAMLTYEWDTVFVEDCGAYGVNMKNEGPNTTNTFINCRFRQSDIGTYMQSMQASTFIGCNWESNKYIGLDINGSTTNTTTLNTFTGCWFENNGFDPVAAGATVGTGVGVRFDMNASVASTYPHNMKFNNCIFSSPSGERDIRIERGTHIIFDQCAFTEFNSTKLSFSTGTGITYVQMIQCSKYKEKPSVAMYASFPALYSANRKGIFYEFYTDLNEFVTNRQKANTLDIDNTVAATGLDLRGVDTVICDTSAGDITLTSLSNVTKGQKISFVKSSASNNLIFDHSAASQGFLLPDGVDLTVTARQVTNFVNNGLTHYKVV